MTIFILLVLFIGLPINNWDDKKMTDLDVL